MGKKKSSDRLITLQVHESEKDEILYIIIRCDNPITTCEILRSGALNLDLVTYGVSVRKHEDKYDQIIGAKQSLVSALRKGLITGPSRKMVWQAFLEKYPPVTNAVQHEQ